MKFLIILLSLLFITSCSTYDSIKQSASDAYEWTKDTAKETVDGVKDVISE